MKSFISDIFRVGISKILIILSGFSTSIIVARTLGPEKNGIIAALIVYPNIFMTIGSLGVRQSVTYFLGKKKYPEDEIKRGIVQIWVLTSFISTISCFLLMFFFSKSLKEFNLLMLAVAPVSFSLFNTYCSGIYLGKNKIKEFNAVNWIPSVITTILSFVTLVILKSDISGYLLSIFLGQLMMFFVLVFRDNFLGFISVLINVDLVKNLIRLGTIYAVSLLVINLNYQLDIVILEQLSSDFEMGIYSRGANIVQYLWQIPMLFSTIIFARSSSSKNSFQFSLKVSQLLRVSLLVIGCISIVLLIISDWIILGMYGTAYIESVSVLRLLLPGVLILTLFKVMNMDLAGRGKPWVSMKAMLPALIINVVLNIILIPKYGADGAAIASTISYSIAGLLFLWFYSSEVQIGIKEILKFKKSDIAPFKGVISKFI
ncbi:flippase [Echinicola jeungdonensis]|uniref:Flippase n=1 Tax=Echinicola jeungdonensis TaxID=709343 RepID=A0ABV5J2S8_9BACT|nr:flippase [Echinicola jeungdonensis]MDN3668121.1 flippase [Echinicola jeungdonensis]